MKRFVCMVLILAICMVSIGSAISENTKSPQKLTDGILSMSAIEFVAAVCISNGYEVDFSTAVVDDKGNLSLTAPPFTMIIHNDDNGKADRITIAVEKLDPKTATDMGVIFGNVVGSLSDINSVEILANIDFNIFNQLKDNSQTLIYGDYKVTCAVDTESDTPYQLTLAIAKPVPVTDQDADLYAAQTILEKMLIKPVAQFSFDSKNDPNKALGKEGKYYSKVTFALSSLSPDAVSSENLSVEDGGSIEVFTTSKDAISRQQDVLSKEFTYLSYIEYSLVCGNALLRLSSELLPEEVGSIVTAFVTTMNGNPPQELAEQGDRTNEEEEKATMAEEEPQVLPSTSDNAKQDAKKWTVGETVLFGTYPTSSSGKKEPISWTVVSVEGNQALLIADHVIDVYNLNWNSPTWDKSSLRQWLNNDFIKTAFSDDEADALIETEVSADQNPFYDSDPGEKTLDKVFCPSVVELNRLIPEKKERMRLPTDYARKQGVWRDANGMAYWWTRSPGPKGCGAASVTSEGDYDYDVSYDGFGYGVCPMILIDTSNKFFSAGDSGENDIDIEGQWQFEGWYVADDADEELKKSVKESGLEEINVSLTSGLITMVYTFKGGIVTSKTTILGQTETNQYEYTEYTLEGNQYTDRDGTYMVKIDGDVMTMTKDTMVKKYRRI